MTDHHQTPDTQGDAEKNNIEYFAEMYRLAAKIDRHIWVEKFERYVAEKVAEAKIGEVNSIPIHENSDGTIIDQLMPIYKGTRLGQLYAEQKGTGGGLYGRKMYE